MTIAPTDSAITKTADAVGIKASALFGGILTPARTDTAWWHDYAMKGAVRFIRRRVRFAGHKGYAPFPSAVVIFAPNNQKVFEGICADSREQ